MEHFQPTSSLMKRLKKRITSTHVAFIAHTFKDQTWTVLSNEELNRNPPARERVQSEERGYVDQSYSRLSITL